MSLQAAHIGSRVGSRWGTNTMPHKASIGVPYNPRLDHLRRGAAVGLDDVGDLGFAGDRLVVRTGDDGLFHAGAERSRHATRLPSHASPAGSLAAPDPARGGFPAPTVLESAGLITIEKGYEGGRGRTWIQLTKAGRQAVNDEIAALLRAVVDVHAELLVHVRHQGRPRRAHDLIIAATARTASRKVVSADATAFADLPGVQVHPHR